MFVSTRLSDQVCCQEQTLRGNSYPEIVSVAIALVESRIYDLAEYSKKEVDISQLMLPEMI